MRVVEVEGSQDDFFDPPVATVETEGVSYRVRLDIVDRFPKAGDYVIVHAGFAIHTMGSEDAQKSLFLLKEIAEGGTHGQ